MKLAAFLAGILAGLAFAKVRVGGVIGIEIGERDESLILATRMED